ncbi:MAG: ATP-binding protein [Oscillospiraceae bacterium]|nr:ATP-binding protein [Oscillospiraceae bacterium]
MVYPQQVVLNALKILEDRRNKAEQELQEKKKRIFESVEELGELSKEIAQVSLLAVKAVANGGTAEHVEQFKLKSLELQKKRDDLLKGNGIPKDYLKCRYYCEKCHDTGYLTTGLCDCLKKLLINESAKDLNMKVPLDKFSFDNFRLEFYDTNLVPGLKEPITPREQAKKNLDFCKEYASNFSKESPNLLLGGGTGLGKTHLSLAIVKEVLKKGYSVVYISAVQLVLNLEGHRFNSDEQNKYSIDSFLECDLLVIDDFGSEPISSFSVASVYNIINTRLMQQKQTIINTNLSGQRIVDQYEERVASRLLGEYYVLKFYGRDIRQIKHLQF